MCWIKLFRSKKINNKNIRIVVLPEKGSRNYLRKTEISKERNPQGLTENARIAKEGADVAKAAREDVEKRLGRSVVSSEKAIDYIQSPAELPYEKPDDQ